MESSPFTVSDYSWLLRCSTPFGINGIITAFVGTAMCIGTGAQRLSASMESSRVSGRCGEDWLGVLNAFRHQWNHHASNIVASSIPGGCSTPFGINGIITRFATGGRGGYVCVLNAFRHQWNHHMVGYGESRKEGLLCSTPFGINGIITQTRLQGRRANRRAQRLSASMESSRSGMVKAERRDFCAQRLSASMESSQKTN